MWRSKHCLSVLVLASLLLVTWRMFLSTVQLSTVAYLTADDQGTGTFAQIDERTSADKDVLNAVHSNAERHVHLGRRETNPGAGRSLDTAHSKDTDQTSASTHSFTVATVSDNGSEGDPEGKNDDTATVARRLLKDPTAVNGDPDKVGSPYILTKQEAAFCLQWKDKQPPQRDQDEEKAKLILYWQEEEHFPETTFKDRCFRPTKGPCKMTFDASQQPRADAVIFHASRINRPEPPFRKPPGQVWIARSLEAPPHWCPDYKAPGWRGVFNWTFTYAPDSDIFSPVGHLVREVRPPKRNFRLIAAKKTRSVAWFVSTCHTQGKYGSRREDFAKELGKHIDVDIYGKCGTLTCAKNQGLLCYDLLTLKYRFYLSAENTVCRSYVTEKFFDKFHAQVDVIPVVLGGADYRKYFPDGTYINAADFSSPKDLAKYLHALGKKLDDYAAMLERKAWFSHSRCKMSEPWCKLCDMLHEPHPIPKVYDDVSAWLDNDACLQTSNLSYYWEK
ncbi:alpha-(1,3)-fucosyltransferase C-like [Littorina saxatilis]|uniref:Fucosyltransferase n=1 Tax=Littorina saxatilis TaxID=31220 RepID=A0AAN9GFR6_9CAEN